MSIGTIASATPAAAAPIAVLTTSRRATPFNPFKPGAFALSELVALRELVLRFQSLDLASPSPSYASSLSSHLLAHGLTPLPPAPATSTLADALLSLKPWMLDRPQKALLQQLERPLYYLARLPARSNDTLAYHSGKKLRPRSQFSTMATVLGLVGACIGMPDMLHVTVLLRQDEDYDAVRTSLKAKIEDECLVPFLHCGVFVPGNAITARHLHLLVLARKGEREEKALHRFANERNKRSGIRTGVDIRDVYDLDNLIRPKPPWDQATNRICGPVGYLSGNRNLTIDGSKFVASQPVRRGAKELLAGGPFQINRLRGHLHWASRP